MNNNTQIPALPIIGHLQRYRDALADGVIGSMEYAWYCRNMLNALSMPFNPKDVPEILQGNWDISNTFHDFGPGAENVNDGIDIILSNEDLEENLLLKFNLLGMAPYYSIGEWEGSMTDSGTVWDINWTPVVHALQTLNDFLSDLKRSGIAETFTPEFSREWNLK